MSATSSGHHHTIFSGSLMVFFQFCKYTAANTLQHIIDTKLEHHYGTAELASPKRSHKHTVAFLDNADNGTQQGMQI